MMRTYFNYPVNIAVPAGVGSLGTPVSVQFREQKDFRIHAIHSQQTGIYDAIVGTDQVDFFSDYIRASNIFGTAILPHYIDPPRVFQRNSVLRIRTRNQIAGANTVQLVLEGEFGDFPQPNYSEGWFVYLVSVVIGAGIGSTTITSGTPSVQFMQGYDFRLRSIQSVSTGIYDAVWGTRTVFFQNDPVRNTSQFGSGVLPHIFNVEPGQGPPWRWDRQNAPVFPQGSMLVLSFTNQIAGANTVTLAVEGELGHFEANQ